MDRVAAESLKRNFGKWLRATRDGPIEISHRGKPTAYLISAELFHKLWQRYLASSPAEVVVPDEERKRQALAIAKAVRAELESFQGAIDQAFLFGSVVPANPWRTPNIDLMVVADLTIFDLAPALERLESLLGRVVHLNLFGSDEWKRVATNPFIQKIMAESRIQVI